MHQLCPLRAQGQGHQKVCHPEHSGGGCCEGHLRSQCLRLLRSAQALREAALLRKLRHPQQGGEEPLSGGQEGPDTPSTLQTQWWCPSCSPQTHVTLDGFGDCVNNDYATLNMIGDTFLCFIGGCIEICLTKHI